MQTLTSRELMQALREGALGKIAITYFEWAGEFDQKIDLLPWRLIEGPEPADAVAAELARAPTGAPRAPRLPAGSPSPSRCSTTRLSRPAPGDRVSGDGA